MCQAHESCPAWARQSSCLHPPGATARDWSAQAAWHEYDQEYRPHACALRPWDAAAFGACMRGRRIVLIGDSLMRQMFQSLACLLGPQLEAGRGADWGATFASRTSCTCAPLLFHSLLMIHARPARVPACCPRQSPCMHDSDHPLMHRDCRTAPMCLANG